MGEIEVICKNILHNTPFYSFENPLFNKQYFILLQTDEKYKEKISHIIGTIAIFSSSAVEWKGKYYICLTDLWQKASDLNKAYKQAEKLVRHVKLGQKNIIKISNERCKQPEEYSEEYYSECVPRNQVS